MNITEIDALETAIALILDKADVYKIAERMIANQMADTADIRRDAHRRHVLLATADKLKEIKRAYEKIPTHDQIPES